MVDADCECECERCRSIADWIDSIVAEPRSENKIPFPPHAAVDFEMPPTPPGSSRQPRSPSPKKRLRRDSDDELFFDPDPDTPRSSRPVDSSLQRSITTGSSQALPLRTLSKTTHPSFPPSTATTTTSKRSGRSTSPAKRTQSLQALEKPVSYVFPEKNMGACLPEDIQPLFKKLRDIAGHEGFLPAAAKELVEEATDTPVKTWWLRPPGDEQREQEGEALAAQREFEQLVEIRAAVSQCEELGRPEAGWNLDVHGPLLKLATKHTPGVERELVTVARIAPPFMPPIPRSDYGETGAGGPVVESKMVDFALVISPFKDEPLYAKLRRAAFAQPIGEQTVSQSTFGPLLFRPPAVSVETKISGGDSEKGKVQVAVWTASWHRRMEKLVASSAAAAAAVAATGGRGAGDARTSPLITLPVMLVVEHDWRVYFAVDRGSEGKGIEMVGPLRIGGTDTLIDMYVLLASLRELAAWTTGPFREWVEDLFAWW